MIKKTAAFQNLLINSLSFRSKGSMSQLLPMWIMLLSLSALNASLSPIVGSFGGMMIFPMLSLFFVYRIVNANAPLYAFVPVSADYIVGNLFLFAVLLTFFYLVILSAVGFAVLGIVFAVAALAGYNGGRFSVFAAGSPPGFEGMVFILFVILIVLFAVTALSCIKKRAARVSAMTVFIALCLSALLALKHHFPASGGAFAFATGAYLNRLHWVVAFTGALCLLIIPLSLLLGRHFYRGRMKPFTTAERQG